MGSDVEAESVEAMMGSDVEAHNVTEVLSESERGIDAGLEQPLPVSEGSEGLAPVAHSQVDNVRRR